jgi:site-specific recombinase XerD
MDDQLPLFSTPEPEIGATMPMAPQEAGLTGAASLTAAIMAWREHLEREHSPPNTVKAFVGDLNLAAQFVGAFKNVGQVATRDLDNWLQWQRTNRKCSPKTYARRVTSLKSFFRWLHQSGVLAADPAAPLIQQSVISPLPDVLSEAEVEAALDGARAIWQGDNPNPTPYVLLTLLLRTGIKKGETLALEPNHLDISDPAQPVLWVRHKDPRHRYKERKLQLDVDWLPAYHAYLDYRARYLGRQGSRAAQRAERLFPWSPRRLEYWLQDISQAAGLSKQISFDMCRWTCALRDAQAGVDENHIRQKLGLSKIQWREIGMKLRKLAGPAL